VGQTSETGVIAIMWRTEMFAPQKMIKLGTSEKIISGCTHDLIKEDFFDNYIRKI
jgi:hypothetical protein